MSCTANLNIVASKGNKLNTTDLISLSAKRGKANQNCETGKAHLYLETGSFNRSPL